MSYPLPSFPTPPPLPPQHSKTGELERGQCHMQRAISVNTTTNLALDTSHMLLSGYSASSPTGSESLAAPPLNELYRYHVFLSHCAQDVGWVQEAVARLQAPPFGYKCTYTPEVEQVNKEVLKSWSK